MNARRLPLFRSEISSNFDAGESSSLMTVRYDPAATSRLIPSPDEPTGNFVSQYPIVIYDYEVQFGAGAMAMLFQYYCDYGDLQNAENWEPENTTFTSSLKKNKMVLGAKQDGTTFFDRSVMRFKARGFWSKKHKEWRWSVPPIVLSSNKLDTFGISIANISGGQADRDYYAFIKIRKWHQMM